MSTRRPLDHHLSPDEAFRFIEKTLAHIHLREVEEHLNHCLDCVAYLAAVVRSARPVPKNGEGLSGRSPEELLAKLRPQIIASTPRLGRRTDRGWVKWAPAAAAVAGLFVVFFGLQTYVVGPARGRQLATKAMEYLVSMRQGTGRIPLRYIPDFNRARVSRSGFDTGHPAEAAVEVQLRQAVELAPREPQTHTALGLFLLDTGALDEAEIQFKDALEIDPDSALAANGWAVVQYERSLLVPSRSRDLIRRGLAILRDAQRKHPEDLQVAFNLAWFFHEAGFREAARAAWTSYIEMDPDSEWADVAAEKLNELGG